VRRSSVNRRNRQRIWFEQWMREGYSVRQLHDRSGYPPRTLWRIIHHWLGQRTPPLGNLSAHQYLVIDSTYLCGRHSAITAVMEVPSHRVIAGAYGVPEGSQAMRTFAARLAHCGLTPIAVTTDGNPQLLRYLRAQWPHVTLQRCLVHIQRQGLSWCRRRPARADARQLRRLFCQLSNVRSAGDRDQWIAQFIAWEQRYGWRIDLTPEHGYVFSDLKRARSLLVHALPNMFHYLDDPQIVHHSNGLEGYFGRFKMRYRQHRGLTREHRQAFVQWYLHLCPK
jgi:hypothetical protein